MCWLPPHHRSGVNRRAVKFLQSTFVQAKSLNHAPSNGLYCGKVAVLHGRDLGFVDVVQIVGGQATLDKQPLAVLGQFLLELGQEVLVRLLALQQKGVADRQSLPIAMVLGELAGYFHPESGSGIVVRVTDPPVRLV